MEVYWNELSFRKIEYTDSENLTDVFKALNRVGISKCRLGYDDQGSIIDGFKTINSSPDFVHILYSFFVPPYETDSVNKIQEEYLAHDWQFAGKGAYGLALAYLTESATYSLADSQYSLVSLPIVKDIEQVHVDNVFDKESADHFCDKLQARGPVFLVTCNINPADKQIKLRDDHGKDLLEAFARRINCSKYVVGVVNSLPFNPHRRRFILNCGPDGVVNIVLPWTDEGLGLAVKTTGRNIRETEEIAKLIEKEYGRIA